MENKNYDEKVVNQVEKDENKELLEEIEEAVTASALGCASCCG
jgi:hypothetical protein